MSRSMESVIRGYMKRQKRLVEHYARELESNKRSLEYHKKEAAEANETLTKLGLEHD